MKTSQDFHSGGWMGSTIRSAVTTIIMAAMTWSACGLARAGGTVTSCSETNLRAALAGGGTVTFACDGTIALAGTISISDNTVLDATGHQITISGNGSVQVFSVSTNVTFSLSNLTTANGYSTNGAAAGGVAMVSGVFVNTLLASTAPVNCSGTVVDARGNLSSDASAAFTSLGSRTNVNPMLGPLANNGGPTLTMALLPGSPAIDAGLAVGAPATDQRGFARPQGPGGGHRRV